jgi:THO complex subunit 2
LDTKKTAETTTKEDEPVPSGNPFNQKAGLVHALAAIGDLKSARIVLDRVPQLSQMHPSIADAFSRIIHVVIEKVEQPLRPLAGFEFTKKTANVDDFMPPIPTLNLTTSPLDLRVSVGRKSYPPSQQFFYLDWKNDIPTPPNCAGVIKVIKSLLVYVAPHLYRDVRLIGKIIRIGKFHLLESGKDDSAKNFWLTIISQCIFPAVSQLYDNSPIMHDLWDLLESFPYSTRYALYGEWRHLTYESIPELAIAASGCRKDIQYIMNRLSKDNIKTYGRMIGKIVHSNPTLAFSYILNAIEGYDNMIPFVVEATRYLTDLEFDILCYCLLEALSRQSKVRIERNGTTIEKWLKSLSNFCGQLFKRHSIDLDGILQYIANQLLSNQVYDLVVFQELISSMSGINPPEDATVVQMDGFAGGPVLRRESLLDNSQAFFKPAARLGKSLSSADLALPLGVLIAQQRKEIVYRFGKNEEDPSLIPDLKVLAWLNDHVIFYSNLVPKNVSPIFCIPRRLNFY